MSTATTHRVPRQQTTAAPSTVETQSLENPALENTQLENTRLENTQLENPTIEQSTVAHIPSENTNATTQNGKSSVRGRVIKGVKHTYTILEQLAGGSEGFATVSFKAESEGKLYVLKGKTVGLMQDPYELWKTTKEVSAALTNLNQPCLVTDTEVLVNGPYVINVRPWIQGKTLDEIVTAQRFTSAETREFGINIAKQLGGAHSKNIIHRDIKPNNIIRSADGDHLIDFGVAKKIERAEDPDEDENLTNMTIVGTPAYRAPEIMFGRADARADIYSLGHTLLYTLTGKHPTKAGTEEQKYDYTIKAINKLDIDETLKETLCVMTNPDKASRYKTMDEVIAALDPLAMERTTQETVEKITTAQTADDTKVSDAEQTPETYDAVKLLREKGSAGLEHRIALLKKEFKERYTVQGPIPDAMDSALTKDLHVTLTELGYELQPFSNSTSIYNGVRKRKDGSGIDVVTIKVAPRARTTINEKHVEYRFVKNEYALVKLEKRLLDEIILDHAREENIELTRDGNRTIAGLGGGVMAGASTIVASGSIAIVSTVIAPAAVPIIIMGGLATSGISTIGATIAKAYPEIPYAIARKFRQWRDTRYHHSTEAEALEAALTIDTSRPKSKYPKSGEYRKMLAFANAPETSSGGPSTKSLQPERDDRYNGYFAKLEKAAEQGTLKTVTDVVRKHDPREGQRHRVRESTTRETATYADPIDSAKERGDLAKKDLEAALRSREIYDRAQRLTINPYRMLDNGYSMDEIETIKELGMTPEEHDLFLTYADEHYAKAYPGVRMQRDRRKTITTPISTQQDNEYAHLNRMREDGSDEAMRYIIKNERSSGTPMYAAAKSGIATYLTRDSSTAEKVITPIAKRERMLENILTGSRTRRGGRGST